MTIETKLQIEALKALENEVKKESYAEDEDYVYFTFDGYRATRIAKQDFFLDTDKLTLSESLSENFDSGRLADTYKLSVTDEMRDLKPGTLTILKCEKFRTGINTDFLKMYLKKGGTPYAKSEKSPIYFTWGDKIFAIVMPISLKQEE
ncbi:MAG: hypothetical protein NC320_00980 [Clostridium sp.]|nr:hypothetical protein [Clostridium sp.]